MRKMETGDSIKACPRRIAELEEQQKNLLTQARKQIPFTASPVTEKSKPDPLPSGADLLDASKAIARRAAEISETIDDQNKRPKKTFITPSTRGVGYAMYYKTIQKKIEDVGTLNFPNSERPQAVRPTGAVDPGVPGRHDLRERRRASRSTAAPATRRWMRRR
jgi:protein TonB